MAELELDGEPRGPARQSGPTSHVSVAEGPAQFQEKLEKSGWNMCSGKELGAKFCFGNRADEMQAEKAYLASK
jgi:hypothetical protein